MSSSSYTVLEVRRSFIPHLMLGWYVLLFLAMAVAPVDPLVWWSMNILPETFVALLAWTYRMFPLSNASYMLITMWLTLHTIAAHHTYPKVPVGFWLDQWCNFHRNHFDRIVHFSFGFFITFPLVEVFRRRCNAKGWLLPYLVVITVLGFSAFWEIIEAWVGQVAHRELESPLVGHQCDVWDPQHDMAAALYGSLLYVGMLAILRKLHLPEAALSSEPDVSDALALASNSLASDSLSSES